MKQPSYCRLLTLFVLVAYMIAPVHRAHAQEAEVVSTIAREIVEALGKDVAEFGGEEIAQQTAKRLMTEATEASGDAGRRVAQKQIERITAERDTGAIVYLKTISFSGLKLLEGIPDKALVLALGTLARPGVVEGLESLGSDALRKAALSGEIRLPGAGLKLVQYYGDEGTKLAADLNEDQANSMIAVLRPNAVNALPSAERSNLFSVMRSRPDARVFDLDRATGPLVVVASGMVIWHGMNLTLSPDERVTERSDGTVIREKTSVGSRVLQSVPMAARELSNPFKWIGVTLVGGMSLILAVYFSRRLKRR